MPPFSIGCRVNSSVRPLPCPRSKAWIVGAARAGRRVLDQARRLASDSRPHRPRRVHQLAQAEAFQLEIRRQSEVLVQLLVRHDDAALGVEHAQAVRHVVERGVEPLAEQRHVARGDDRIEQRAAQPLGDEFHAENEGTSSPAKIQW